MSPPAERFAMAAGADLEVVEPLAAVATNGQRCPGQRADLRSAGVQRWVDQRGLIRSAGFRYRVPIVLAGEPVEAVVADNLVQIYHRDVLVASHVQRRTSDNVPAVLRQGRRTARPVTSGIVVTRVVDNNGEISFAGTMYRAGRPWRGKQVEVSIVAGRCRSPARDQSCAPMPSAMTGPKSTARTPHRTIVPASRARMRRPLPPSRPRRCAVGPRAEP